MASNKHVLVGGNTTPPHCHRTCVTFPFSTIYFLKECSCFYQEVTWKVNFSGMLLKLNNNYSSIFWTSLKKMSHYKLRNSFFWLERGKNPKENYNRIIRGARTLIASATTNYLNEREECSNNKYPLPVTPYVSQTIRNLVSLPMDMVD